MGTFSIQHLSVDHVLRAVLDYELLLQQPSLQKTPIESLPWNFPSIPESTLPQKSKPLSLSSLVSIKNKILGLYSWAFSWHCRTAEGLSSPLQFQLRALMATGEAVEG